MLEIRISLGDYAEGPCLDWKSSCSGRRLFFTPPISHDMRRECDRQDEPMEIQLMNSKLQQGGTSMNPIRYLGVALLFMLGCQAMPTVTRTGDVKDIIIGDNLSSGEIVVNPGDEVRWVNKRTAPVRIVFLDPVSDKQLSCKNNFGGLMTPSNTAKLATNETASACFRDPGYVRYTVRMESANMTGERNVPE